MKKLARRPYCLLRKTSLLHVMYTSNAVVYSTLVLGYIAHIIICILRFLPPGLTQAPKKNSAAFGGRS